mgnify:CR=1 FL=1
MEFTKEDNEAVEWCEKSYPELCTEYKKIMMEQYVMFCKKHRNYGCGNINVGTNLDTEVAFFIAQCIQSNVRELEGALRRVIANSQFTGKEITLGFAKEALRDLVSLQNKMVSIDNIQKTVANYYKIRMSDLLSAKRNRSLARPRQLAMSLAKELTNHSLPEIGDAFGGRDHTTVLHACKKINEVCLTDNRIKEDLINLRRALST